MSFIRRWPLVVPLVLVSILGGCRPADPRAEALRQRARFTVELLSWVPRDDGTVSLTVRVTGPPSTSLETLTVLVTQLDAEGQELSAGWRTLDLAEVPRGAPKELFLSVPSAGDAVEGLTVQLVLDPTEEQIAEIPELRDL